MKKKLSLLMVAFLSVMAFAATLTWKAPDTASEVTLDFTAEAQGYTNGQAVESLSVDDVTASFAKGSSSNAPKYYSTGDALRCYGGNTIALTSEKTITKAVFTFASGEGSNEITADKGTFETDTWTGSENAVTFTIGGSTGHRRIQKIVVTLSGEAAAVAKPVISGETPFLGTTNVTITCATEGAAIHYTTDGTAPTAESTAYTEPFAINATTTVKAIAVKDADQSEVAEKTFTAMEGTATIAALTALEDGATFGFTGEALVVAKPTAKYVYIKDATGACLVYDASGAKTEAAEVGKTIAANWTGKVSIYKQLFELVPDAALVMKAGDADEVTYDEVELADVAEANVNKIVTLKGVTYTVPEGKNFTITKDAAQVAGYNQFGLEIAAPEEGKTYDIVGAISRYDDNIQFQPITITETPAEPVVADVVYDFAAAAAAGENPENLNGGTANGAVFYGWESESKTYSKRQDYKGYTWTEGSVLPSECHVWRRSDRINGNMTEATAEVLGLKCPNQREMAINGLTAGQKVVIEYAGEGEILYATGFDAANPTAEPNTVAVVGDGNKAAVSGTTTIASGTPIHIVSTDNGYIVFRVLKNMIIKKITISNETTPIDPATVVKPNVVTVAAAENGTVKVDKVQAFEGDVVTVTATPAEGFEVETITVKGADETEIAVTDGKFTMPAQAVTVSATFKEIPKFYIIGGPKDWKLDDMTEMTFNAETQAYEYEYAPTTTAYFAFADKQFTAEEAAAEGSWDVFNSTNRYSLGRASDTDPNVEVSPSETALTLIKGVEGTIKLNPGTYKISVAKDFSTVTISGEATPETPAKYYLVGSMTGWEVSEDYELTPDNENEGQYKITKDFAANDAFKIVKGNKEAWYPDGMGNDYTITTASNYTVYFNPAGGVEGWYAGFFNVVDNNPSGINAVKADALKDAQIYTISGQRVDKAQKGLYIVNGRKVVIK